MTFGDYLCDVCINFMEEMSKMLGISYGSLNVLLFVVFGPLSTLMFMISSFVKLISIKNTKIQNNISIVTFILGIIFVLLVILPILYVFCFGKVW